MKNPFLAYSRLYVKGGQQTLETQEDPEKPWIFFAPRKILWKILKLQPIPEKLCSEADFPPSNFWPGSTVTFLIWGKLCDTSNIFPPFGKSCNSFLPFGRISNIFLPFSKFCNIVVEFDKLCNGLCTVAAGRGSSSVATQQSGVKVHRRRKQSTKADK